MTRRRTMRVPATAGRVAHWSVALLVLPDFLMMRSARCCAPRAFLRRRLLARPSNALVYFVLFRAAVRALAGRRSHSPTRCRSSHRRRVTLAASRCRRFGQPLCRLPANIFAACFPVRLPLNTYIAIAVARAHRRRGRARAALAPDRRAVPLVTSPPSPCSRAGARRTWARAQPAIRWCSPASRARLERPCAAAPRLAMRNRRPARAAALPSGCSRSARDSPCAAPDLPPAGAIAWWLGVKLLAFARARAGVSRACSGSMRPQTSIAVRWRPCRRPRPPTCRGADGAPGAPVALLRSTGTIAAAVTLPLWLRRSPAEARAGSPRQRPCGAGSRDDALPAER